MKKNQKVVCVECEKTLVDDDGKKVERVFYFKGARCPSCYNEFIRGGRKRIHRRARSL